MDRFRPLRRIQVEPEPADPPPAAAGGGEAEEEEAPAPAAGLLMGAKVRRRAAVYRDCKGDYIGVPNDPCLTKILSKQGDNKVLFADKVLKFTQSGKMKRRILVITDFALYLVDPDADILKRRIALAAVDRLCISNLSDNFFAIIVPTEYDCLMASTRKKEIVDVIVKAIKSTSEYEPEVASSNRFEYHAAAEPEESKLSEPVLKYQSNADLKNALLRKMIHAICVQGDFSLGESCEDTLVRATKLGPPSGACCIEPVLPDVQHASPLEPVLPDVSVLISGPPIKDPGALLRNALPIDNKAIREVQKPPEDITYSLKVAERLLTYTSEMLKHKELYERQIQLSCRTMLLSENQMQEATFSL